jgi:hypothetical protein
MTKWLWTRDDETAQEPVSSGSVKYRYLLYNRQIDPYDISTIAVNRKNGVLCCKLGTSAYACEIGGILLVKCMRIGEDITVVFVKYY